MKWIQAFLVVTILAWAFPLFAADDGGAAPAPAVQGPVRPPDGNPAPATGPAGSTATPPAATGPAPATTPGATTGTTPANTSGTAENGTGNTVTSTTKNQEPPQSALSQLSGMLPFFLIMAFVLYFLLIRPEQKRRKEQEAMLSTIKKGSTVLTHAGMYGTVQEVQGETVLVAIDQAQKVVVKMQKSYISGVTGMPASAPAAETK